MIESNGKLAMYYYVHFVKANMAFASPIRTWGGARTVKTKMMTMPKLADHGVQLMFVRYAKDHTGNTYCMWNPTTKRVHVTRDIIWLKHTYYKKWIFSPSNWTSNSEE
jgi:hypothetical protein